MDRQALVGLTQPKNKDGILVIEAPTTQKANAVASEILQKYCDLKTALFLSGGKTPKKLYEEIAKEKNLKVGAALMVDERFGEKLHRHSNELMIKNTGIIKYFEDQNIRFYPILAEETSIENATSQYDESLRYVLKYFPKSVGILGIGTDSHTAGIPAIPTVAKRILEDQSSLVTYYDDEGEYGQRITMTFLALTQLDLIILLVLGQEKRKALKLMFSDARLPAPDRRDGGQGPIEEVPARFYLRPEIAGKTILITDQIV